MRNFSFVLTATYLLFLLAGCSRNGDYYLAKGSRASAAGNDTEAILNYRKAIQKEPQLGEAHLRLGLALQRQSNMADAYGSLRQAFQLLPSSDEAAVKFADVCVNIYIADPKRPGVLHDQVSKIAERFLSKDSKSFDGLRLKGDLALIDGRSEEAVDLFRQAEAVRPMQPGVVLPLARSLFETNGATEAEALTLQLIAKEKSAEAAYDLLYRFYHKENRIADAENILRRRVQGNPASAAAHLQLAAHYASRKEYPQMEEALRPLLDNPKQFPQARLQAGDLYNSQGNLEKAAKLYEDGLAASTPDKRAYQKRLIELRARQGRRDEVSKLLDAALSENPTDDELKLAKANLLVSTGKRENIQAAIPLFQESLKAKPDDLVRRLELSRATLLSGDLDLAKAQLVEVLRRMPSSLPVRAMLADIALRKKDYSEALRYTDEILQAQPEFPGASLVRSASLMGLGRFKEARLELQKLPAAQSKTMAAQMQLGNIELAEGRVKEAESTFRKLYQSGQADLRPLEGMVMAQVGQRRTDTALRLIQDELAKAPDSVALRALLAKTAAQSGNADLAIEQYRQLVARNPKVTDWYLPLGEILRSRGDYPGALAQFEAARRLAPKDVRFVMSVAAVESIMGRKEAARESSRQALALQPGNPYIMNNLAYLIAETGGNAQEAQRLVQDALKQQPNEPNFLDTQGTVYQKSGQSESALRIFQNLVRQYPDNPGFRYHLAGSLASTGDRAQARKALTAALELKPNERLAGEIRQLQSTLN